MSQLMHNGAMERGWAVLSWLIAKVPQTNKEDKLKIYWNQLSSRQEQYK
jgi:hypothetical protein